MSRLLLTCCLVPALLAGCKPACGLHMEAGGEAVIRVSHRTPTGPDASWTVPGLTQTELEGYDAWAGVASPAQLSAYLWVEEIDGYVIATDRERDGWDPQLHLAAPIDGFLDECFVEPLTRATLEFVGGAYSDGLLSFRLFPEGAASDEWSITSVKVTGGATVDFDEGYYRATGLRMNVDESALVDPHAACLQEIDLEVEWETDRDVRLDIPNECPHWISMTG
ncbi:MAG: hypothetical protein KC621_31495 [Myxococcales bacterium]|nr:hypothetical protein [Myxococcales bacterium]